MAPRRVTEAPLGADSGQTSAGKKEPPAEQTGVALNLAAVRWLFMARNNASGSVRAPGRALLMLTPVVLAAAAVVVLGVKVIGPREAAVAEQLRDHMRESLETVACTLRAQLGSLKHNKGSLGAELVGKVDSTGYTLSSDRSVQKL